MGQGASRVAAPSSPERRVSYGVPIALRMKQCVWPTLLDRHADLGPQLGGRRPLRVVQIHFEARRLAQLHAARGQPLAIDLGVGFAQLIVRALVQEHRVLSGRDGLHADSPSPLTSGPTVMHAS